MHPDLYTGVGRVRVLVCRAVSAVGLAICHPITCYIVHSYFKLILPGTQLKVPGITT